MMMRLLFVSFSVGLLASFFSLPLYAADSVSVAQPSFIPNYQDPFSGRAIVQLVLGLVVVVGLIFVFAWLFRRFSNFAPIAKNMRVLGVLPLGTREKAVLVQVGSKQLLLGVAPGRVTNLQTFDEAVVEMSKHENSFAKRLNEAIKQRKDDADD